MKLSERTVTKAIQPLGTVEVRVKKPGSELTYATVGTVMRVTQAGETFYAWRVGSFYRGTHEKYTGAVLVTAQHIERQETRP